MIGAKQIGVLQQSVISFYEYIIFDLHLETAHYDSDVSEKEFTLGLSYTLISQITQLLVLYLWLVKVKSLGLIDAYCMMKWILSTW